MEKSIEFVNSFYGGLVLLVLGIYFLTSSLKLKDKSFGSIIHPFLQGMLAGIGLTVLGITILIKNWF